MFWALESIYWAATVRREKLIRHLEMRLATKNFESDEPTTIYFYLSDDAMTWREKLVEWIVAVLTKETLSALYVLLIIASILFILLIDAQGVLAQMSAHD